MSGSRNKEQELLALLGKLSKITGNGDIPSLTSIDSILNHNYQLASSMRLPDDDSYRKSNISGSALFSNDRQFSSTIQALAQQPKIETDKLRIGICIGESHFLSLLPELEKHIDCLLLCDIDAYVMASTAYQLVCIKQARDYESFKTALLSVQHPVIQTQFISMVNLRNLYEPHQAMLDPIHQIQNRFTSIKNTLTKLPIYILPMNFLQPAKTQVLRNIFQSPEHRAQVTVLNLTNLHHYDANWPIVNYALLLGDKTRKPSTWVSRKQISTVLQELIGKEDTLCHLLYSTFTPWSGTNTVDLLTPSTLRSKFSRSIAEYKNATEEECTILRDANNILQLTWFFKKKGESQTLTASEQKQLDITIQQTHEISHSRLQKRVPFFSVLIESEKGVGLPPGSYKLEGQPPILPSSELWLEEEKEATPSIK